MKKILVFIFILSALVVFSVSASAELVGDVDFNGKVTATDARLILRKSVKLSGFDSYQTKVGDVDFNGEITAADARLVLRVSTGLSSFSQTQVVCNEPKIDFNNYDLIDKTVEITVNTGNDTVKGRGVFAYAGGLVITNYHIIKDAISIQVYDRDTYRTYNVNWVSYIDEKNNIAVLHINGDTSPNTYCPVMPEIGEKVYFCEGSSYYAYSDEYAAVVTGYDYDSRLNSNIKYLKVSKNISSDHSGAPVFDENGNLIGITMWHALVPAGTTYIIPINFIYSMNLSSPITMKSFAKQNGSPYINTLKADKNSIVINPCGYAVVKLTVDKRTAPYSFDANISLNEDKLHYVWSEWFDLNNDNWYETIFISFTAKETFNSAFVSFYISGYNEIMEEIYVSCAKNDNIFYPGPYGVPDIGMYMNTMLTGLEYDPKYAIMEYDFTNNPMTNAQVAGYNKYFDDLAHYGFKYVCKDSNGYDVYKNSATGRYIYVGIEYAYGTKQIQRLLIMIE